MQVEFRTKKLEKQYRESKQAIREYGEAVAKRYVQRINAIKYAKSIEEVRKLPGFDCHLLKGDREGEWSVNLINRMRLIFTLKGKKLEIVRIKEVSKHYGD